MLDRCSNPDCNEPFRYLRRGRLFALATGGRRHSAAVRWHWLCDVCARHLSLRLDERGELVIMRQEQPVRPSQPAA